MTCPDCATPVQSDARHCTACGVRLARTSGRTPWIVAAGALVLLAVLAGIAIPEQRARAARAVQAPALNPAAGAGAVPPDIGSMTPRERFDRLYARALEAAQSGDDAGAARFTPMALAAYGMLDTIDADARYHAALLHLHAGNAAPARLLADTIRLREPGHLFSPLIRATAARWERDTLALGAAYRDLLSSADAELARSRPEYDAHRATIDEARRIARSTVRAAP